MSAMGVQLATVVVLCLVGLSTQHQPPGVPPRNSNPQQGHHGEGAHGQPLQFSSEVHNADHILEHLQNVISTKSKDQMTEEELEFHYFKLHDYDNNNKLDGVEIGKALTHFHDESPNKNSDAKVFGDSEISNIVDSVLTENDENKDGYIEYFEFKRKQDSSRSGSQQQQGEQKP